MGSKNSKIVHCAKVGRKKKLKDARDHYDLGCAELCDPEIFAECRRGGRRDEEEADVLWEEQENQTEGGARDGSSSI